MTRCKTIKKLVCLVMVLAMLLVLTGCGLGAAITAAKTARAMSKIESFSAELTVDLECTALGVAVPAVLTAPVNCTVGPFMLEADSEIEMSGTSLPLLKIYMEKDGSLLNLYLGSDAGASLGIPTIWTAQQTKLSGDVKLDVKTVMGIYMALSDSFEAAGTETVGSFTAQRYDGTLPRALVSKLFEGSGGMSFGNVTVSEDELIDALSDTAVSFWLDTDSSRLVKLEADLSGFADKLSLGMISQLPVDVELSIEKAVVSFTMEDFDCVDNIVIPEDAKAALESKSEPPV